MDIYIPFLDKKKMKPTEMVIIFQSLSFMVMAGMSIHSGLKLLLEDEASSLNKRGLNALLDSMGDGLSFPQAMKENEDILGEGYWRQLEAATRTGKVPECLMRLAEQIKMNRGIVGKIRGAMAYPTFVLSIALIAGYIMFTSAIPEMAAMMAEFDAELPLMTQVMLGLSEMMISYGIFVVGFLVLFVGIFIYLIRHQWKLKWHKFLCRLPIVGPVVINMNYASLFRVISDMIENGDNPAEAVRVAGSSVKNVFIQKEIDHCFEIMSKEAVDMSVALGSATTIPNDDRLMLAVGKRTGRVIEILGDLAVRRRQKAIEAVDALLEMMSPIIMAVVCAIVGTLVVSIYLPMITISQSIG